MLPASDAVVAALRARMAALMGYPEEALEPLQGVRYTPATVSYTHLTLPTILLV